MKNALRTAAVALVVLVLYLLLWPVPIEPTAWHAPEDKGLVDPFGPDDRLKAARGIALGEHQGPEDIATGPGGQLYAGTEDGAILAVSPSGRFRTRSSPPA